MGLNTAKKQGCPQTYRDSVFARNYKEFFTVHLLELKGSSYLFIELNRGSGPDLNLRGLGRIVISLGLPHWCCQCSTTKQRHVRKFRL